jgi:hypothetical protein
MNAPDAPCGHGGQSGPDARQGRRQQDAGLAAPDAAAAGHFLGQPKAFIDIIDIDKQCSLVSGKEFVLFTNGTVYFDRGQEKKRRTKRPIIKHFTGRFRLPSKSRTLIALGFKP